MQIKVNGSSLDNGSWRRLLGQISLANPPGGTKLVMCEFIIQGSTPDELNTRWSSTKSDFEKLGPSVQVWADSTATLPTENMALGDGNTGSIETRVSWSSSHTQTGLSLICVFTCLATYTANAVSGGTHGIQFAGQGSEINLSTSYNAGAITSRLLEVKFVPTFNGSAHGPYTLSAVESGSGGARFVLSGSPSLPAFAAGTNMRIQVTGTTGYNGFHEIIAIDDTTDKITTNTTFGSPESGLTGSVIIGKATTGYDNYIAARNDLLEDYMLVTNSGGYSATEGLALVGEIEKTLDQYHNEVLITLKSEYMPSGLSNVAAARAFDLVVGVATPDSYDPNGGDIPIIYTAKGTVAVDKDTFATTSLATLFLDAYSGIKTEVERQCGQSLKLTSKSFVLSPNSMAMDFELTFVAESLTTVSYQKSTQLVYQDEWTSHKDADGYTMIQVPVDPVRVTANITVERIGLNDTDLSNAIQPPFGTWRRVGVTQIHDAPRVTPNGDTMYRSVWTATYEKVKYRNAATK